MRELSIDIETRSRQDLKKTGVYRYVECPDFSILLFCYSLDGAAPVTIDLYHGERVPTEILMMLIDPGVRKTAHNVQFEFNCIERYFGLALDISQWDCTLVRSGSLSLPLALFAVGKALRLKEQKDFRGKALINLFCIPNKKTNEFESPDDHLEEWQLFKHYVRQDVIAEMGVREKVMRLDNMPRTELDMYALDQKINAAGVHVDVPFIRRAIAMDEAYKKIHIDEAVALNGLTKPNSVKALAAWLSEELDEEITSIKKIHIPPLIARAPNEVVKRVLEIRQELSKTSVSKFKAMLNSVCADDRIRGLHQIYGASRTGRYAGRLVQGQNLPRNNDKPIDLARRIVAAGDSNWLYILFGSIPAILSQLIRTAFTAEKGHRFIVSDFSAIEAVVIAWLAGDQRRLNIFRTHGMIYEASAADMFKVPIESIDKDSPYRQQGKIAELSLGFGGSYNAVKKMDTKNSIPDADILPLVYRWRDTNPRIVALWRIVNDAVLQVVKTGERINLMKGIKIYLERGVLFIHLPSGRKLTYIKPRIVENRFGGESMAYEGQNQTTNKWELQETYGGKLVENIVQAIARDLLVAAMLRIDAAGYKIVMHVHDEVVTEMPYGVGSVKELNAIMSVLPDWAEGMPVKAAGFENVYYKKE